MTFDLGIRCDQLLPMKNGKAIAQENIFIGISGDKITHISDWTEDYQKKCTHFLHATNKIVMPGLINAHAHLAMNLFRGLEDDVPFHTWLFDKILPLERKLVDENFVRIGTELAALECIQFGTTTVNDMYFFIGTIASTLEKAGLRAIISQPFSDFAQPDDSLDRVASFKKFFNAYKDHSKIQIGLAPHAPYTCNDELLSNVAKLAKEYHARIHIHVSETKGEVDEHIKKYSKSPVERLQELNILGPQTICAHCVHLNKKDIDIMKQTKATISHNPDSNMKLGSGIAPVTDYFKAGIPVALGSDGAASNNDLSIFTAMDLATKLQKVTHNDNTAMVAEQALNCATLGGARALGLEKEIGSIEIGKKADLIFVDLDYPHMKPVHSIASQLVYTTQGLEVNTVICGGQILMQDRKFKTLNKDEIYANTQKIKSKITQAFG